MVRAQRGDQGTAAVEFALVLPVLLLVIFGIIDFGRMLSAKITLTEAAREGARAAAIVSESAGVARIYAVTADLDDPIDLPDVNGCPTPADPDADATATVTYQFQFITPISVMAGLGGTDGRVELEASGLMPCL